MKGMMIAAALLIAAEADSVELKLALYGNGLAGQQVRVAVYSANAPEQFLSDEKFYRGIVIEAKADNFTVVVPDMPPGKYAVSCYADTNKNGKLDKNFLGVPKEMYGLSNDARGMFAPPAFSVAAFEIGESTVTRTIHLR